MHVGVEALDHPPVYYVRTLEGVADFYMVFGYRVIVPKGLEGDVIRLEGDLPVPILVFRRSSDQEVISADLTIYMNLASSEIKRIQEVFGASANKFEDPNGITVVLNHKD